jgi:hypothetical protein
MRPIAVYTYSSIVKKHKPYYILYFIYFHIAIILPLPELAHGRANTGCCQGKRQSVVDFSDFLPLNLDLVFPCQRKLSKACSLLSTLYHWRQALSSPLVFACAVCTLGSVSLLFLDTCLVAAEEQGRLPGAICRHSTYDIHYQPAIPSYLAFKESNNFDV